MPGVLARSLRSAALGHAPTLQFQEKHPPAYAGGSPGVVSNGFRSSKPLGTADLADFCRWRVPFRNRAPRVCSSLYKGLAAGGFRRGAHWICVLGCESQGPKKAPLTSCAVLERFGMLAGQSLGARPGWLGRFFGVSTC